MIMRARVGSHLVPCLALGVSVFGSGCVAETQEEEPVGITEQATTSPDASTFPSTYARQWMTNLSNCIKFDNSHPVVAARQFSYGAVAIYESVVNGMPGYRSLGGQLNGLGELPKPAAGKTYDWPTVLAQTMHRVALETYVFPLRLFFEFTTSSEASLGELGPAQIAYRRLAGVSAKVSEDSIAYANQLADVLVAWINSDGYKEARFKGWIPPEGPDKWVPTGFSDTDKVVNPEEPWFGLMVRPLVMKSQDECRPPGAPAFSTDPDSEFYKAAKEVYDTERHLTDEQREIGAFWADVPGASATPPGHWLALATKYARPLTLDKAAFGYAQGLLALHDAAVAVWNEKYSSNILRPETYIRRHIDPNWNSQWPSPKFPSYTSGHSGFSGSSARMLKVAFGENGPIVDDTKLRRGYGARTFATWDDAAQEAADSRLYGGIHYRFDNEDGLTSGHCVADKALERVKFH